MQHEIVSREKWLDARKRHLQEEREMTHALDRLHDEYDASGHGESCCATASAKAK